MTKVDAVFIGPPKSASTWLYYCFKEHPEVYVPETDSTHYFNILYHISGKTGLRDLFKQAPSHQIKIDMCQDYLAAMHVPERIKENNPDAKIIVCLREPIERSFSHYWHVKKKNATPYDYAEMLKRYDLFRTWMEPGLYPAHLERYLNLFPRNQVLVLWFEDLKKNPEKFLKTVFTFLEIDTEFRPTVMQQRVNEAGYMQTKGVGALLWVGKLMHRMGLKRLFFFLKRMKADVLVKKRISSKGEYERGVPPALKKKLLNITIPEVVRLEKLLRVKLPHWKK